VLHWAVAVEAVIGAALAAADSRPGNAPHCVGAVPPRVGDALSSQAARSEPLFAANLRR